MWKVFDKKFKKYYALKEISKVKVIDKKSINTIKYERELLCNLSHPLIINLHYAFQDYNNLYFVLDLLTGGDLRYQLGRHPRRFFTESQTRFFIACIIESLIYIHSKNIIHRDIKPENLVFDDKGYLHVTDFGIAKFSDNNNINETSGTPGYMAPEVMRGLNHTGSVDYFAVGIITYELMIGKRPYTGKSRKEIKEQMMIKQVYLDDDNIPFGWSHDAADFINRLLLRKDANRLGYYNDYEIKRHPWFKNINFDDLLNKKIRAPFIPRRNHDNYDKKYCQEIEEIGIETNIRYDNYKNDERYPMIFEGFTYYNVDETQLISYNEIYRKPSVKYMKYTIEINTNNNYMINKSKTINLGYDYNKNISQNISPNKVQSSNTKMRSISYCKENSSTTNRIQRSNLRHNQSSLFINNSNYTLRNRDEYIMATPNRRGRITINNDDPNIDNTFRKYANHSYVETNYSKGRTIRRSYSSSNLHNSNFVNVFNLLVNNVNNINNNNILISNSNNNNKQNYSSNYKTNMPINYNSSNKSKIPIDKKNKSNNYKNIQINNYNFNNSNNKSYIEKAKTSAFSYVDNENNIGSSIKNNDYSNNIYRNSNNISFKYTNNSSYKNNNMNRIYNINSLENNKKCYNDSPEKYGILRRNHSYCYNRRYIPHNSIKKIVPISLNNGSTPFKNETIQVQPFFNNNSAVNSNYNKIKTIEYMNNNNIQISNSSIYIDKYKKKDNSSGRIERYKDYEYKNNEKIVNKYGDKKSNVNSAIQKSNIILEKKSSKKALLPIPDKNKYSVIVPKKNGNNYDYSFNKENKIINVPKKSNNNTKTKEEKINTYKKIPIPSNLTKRIERKKLILDKDFSKTINLKINNKGNIINNIPSKSNIINNISPQKNNYNSYYFMNNDKENIKNNICNNLEGTIEYHQHKLQIPINNNQPFLNYNNEFINQKQKLNIIPIKINEKSFSGYQYLENFEKYKKIKNNHDMNKNKHISYNKNNSIDINQNIIKRKINNKYNKI